MTSIIIAGRPNSEEMSECIIVAENICSMYHSSRFTFVLKHPKEWEVYCEDICNLFGIVRKTYPLILFSNGKQIGGQKEFFKLIKETFNCQLLVKEEEEIRLEINREVVDNLTKENSVLVEKEYICRTRGMSITDKINESLNRIPLEHYDTIYSKYNTLENDYKQGFIKDMKVFFKFDHKFTPIDEEYQEAEDVIKSGVLKMETKFYVKKKEEEELRLKMLTKPPVEQKEKNGKENAEGQQEKQQEKDKDKSQNKSSNLMKENVPLIRPEGIVNLSQPKEIKFNYYANIDIPVSSHRKELFIEYVKEGDYDLIINPAFTFYGETMINFNTEYVPPVIIEKQNTITNENTNPENEKNQIESNPNQKEGEGEEQKNNEMGNEGEVDGEREVKEVENNNESKEQMKTEEIPQNEEEKEKTQLDDKMKAEELNSSKIEPKEETKGDQKQEVKIDAKPEAKIQADENEEKEEEPIKIVKKIPDPVYGLVPQIPTTPDEKPTIYNPLIDPTKYTEDSIIIKDYGKLPSLRLMSYDEDLPFYESKLPPYQIQSQVGNSMNIFDYSTDLLNEKKLFALVSIVNETKSYACLRILPYKYTDWKTFGSNKLKIIPKRPVDIKQEDFPLKLKVDQEIQSIKRNLFNEIKKSQVKSNFASILHNREFDSCFKIPNLIKIELFESLGIKHLIKTFPEDQFNILNMKQALSKMMKELEIDNVTGNGYNLICCQEFVFLAPLVSPYDYTKTNVPLFAEPHFFMGVFTLPIIESEWPDSIQGKISEMDLANILVKSTN